MKNKMKNKKETKKIRTTKKSIIKSYWWCEACDNPASVCTCILMQRKWVKIK